MLSRDGGDTWTRLRAGLHSKEWGYPEIWDIDFATNNPDIIMAATLGSPESAFGPDVEDGLYRSSDGGQTWIQLNCGFVNSRVVSVRISPSNPDVAVVGIEGGFPSFTGSGASQYYPGGIFRTEDAGQNWTRVTIGLDDERNGFVIMHMATGSQPQLITVGANHSDTSQNLGFLRSRDIGVTWESFAPNFRTIDVATFGLSSDGNTIYVNESDNYSGWVSRDAGVNWSIDPILQVNGPIAVSPADSNLVIFGSPGNIRRSTDGLSSMKVVLTTPITIREIVFSPSHPNVVYAESDSYFLYRSDDEGLSWRLLIHGRDEVLNTQP